MKEKEIIEYLKTQEKELKENNLIQVYRHISPHSAVFLTKFFLDNGLDPLKYLSIIPVYYADGLGEYYNNEIILPDNIEAIDLYAFANTSATKLQIPSSVYYIRNGAFWSSKLKNIYIDGSPVVGDDAFFDCVNLYNIKINCSEEEWYKQNPHKDSGRENWPAAFKYSRLDARLKFLK